MRKAKKRGRMPAFARDAEKAMRIAVAKVIREHRRRGEPLVVWEKGRVIRVEP